MLHWPGPEDLPCTTFGRLDPSDQSRPHNSLSKLSVFSRPDYCYAPLAGLPARTIKPLQLIQDAAARVVFNEPKKAHVTPLFIILHWLPIAVRIRFKVLMFAYKITTGSAAIYLKSLVQTYACFLQVNDASWCHPKEAQNHSQGPFPGLFPAGGSACLSQFEQRRL